MYNWQAKYLLVVKYQLSSSNFFLMFDKNKSTLKELFDILEN